MSELPYLYHPYELAIAGFSGSGKTTLIKKLLEALSPELRLGYLKHRAHAFAMDHPGKDSFEAAAAGAGLVGISDGQRAALLDHGGSLNLAAAGSWLNCDALLIEGGKDLPLPKLFVLEAEGSPSASFPQVCAWVTPELKDLIAPQPVFARDDIGALSSFVLGHWRAQSAARPLFGLVLSGGLSCRMGEDKGRLHYKGRAQMLACAELLAAHTASVWISARPGQYSAFELAPFAAIEDRFLGLGPLGGILSAQFAFPDVSWLVLACDMPALSELFIMELLAARDPLRFATAPLGPKGIEPLAAIYEPKFLRRALACLGRGELSPRAILRDSRIKSFRPSRPDFLANINRPAERAAWLLENEAAEEAGTQI